MKIENAFFFIYLSLSHPKYGVEMHPTTCMCNTDGDKEQVIAFVRRLYPACWLTQSGPENGWYFTDICLERRCLNFDKRALDVVPRYNGLSPNKWQATEYTITVAVHTILVSSVQTGDYIDKMPSTRVTRGQSVWNNETVYHSSTTLLYTPIRNTLFCFRTETQLY